MQDTDLTNNKNELTKIDQDTNVKKSKRTQTKQCARHYRNKQSNNTHRKQCIGQLSNTQSNRCQNRQCATHKRNKQSNTSRKYSAQRTPVRNNQTELKENSTRH